MEPLITTVWKPCSIAISQKRCFAIDNRKAFNRSLGHGRKLVLAILMTIRRPDLKNERDTIVYWEQESQRKMIICQSIDVQKIQLGRSHGKVMSVRNYGSIISC